MDGLWLTIGFMVNSRKDAEGARTRGLRDVPLAVWDGRWAGQHGIGRFASEVRARMTVHVQDLRGGPRGGSALDVLVPPAAQMRYGAKMFVSPGFGCSIAGPSAQLVTLHDLIHLEESGQSSHLKRLYYERVVRPVVRRTGLVLTVSQFSRSRISEWSGLPLESVIVAPNGYSTTLEAVTGLPVPQRPYILLVSNEKKYKNNSLAFAAMCLLPDELVLHAVGLSARYVHQLAAEVGLRQSRVVLHNGVSDSELGMLYRKAQCLLLPSQMEGFGMPALEAMGAGTATVYVSEAVAEVVGSLGFRVDDAHSSEECAMMVLVAVREKERLSPLLRERAALFNWQRSARVVDLAVEMLIERALRG